MKSKKYHHTGHKNPCGHDAPVLYKPIVNVCSACGQTWDRLLAPNTEHKPHVDLMIVPSGNLDLASPINPYTPMILPGPFGSLIYRWCDHCDGYRWVHTPPPKGSPDPVQSGGFNY